jgi:rod shape-determining protein MreD
MRISLLFGVVTFFLGWFFQIIYLHFCSPWGVLPQWSLLFVLAAGGLGRTVLAQTLGFFWGLSLDATGMGSLGVQAGLLAVVGYVAGHVSRKLDTDQWVTQEIFVFLGTLFLLVGMILLEAVFGTGPNGASLGRLPGWGALFYPFIFNGLAAPLVFWFFRRWAEVWPLENREDL